MKHKEIRLMEIVDKKISYYNMSDLITVVSVFCFCYCKIIDIKFSKNLKVIEDWSFNDCTRLKSIDLTNCSNLREINDGVFVNCQSLNEIYIPDNTNLRDEVFWGCESLEKIRLPNDLKKISTDLFRGCRKLTSIDIPSSVVEIEDYAFLKSGIKELNIPRNVKFSEKGHESIKINYID